MYFFCNIWEYTKELCRKKRKNNGANDNNSIHTGRNYGGRGDVENSDGTCIELKFVNKEKGTKANITQDALTKYGILEDSLSWSKFRKLSKIDQEIDSIAKKYGGTRIKGGKKIKDDKNLEVMHKIIDLATEDKKDYIRMISRKKINKIRLAKFTALILGGFHTIPLIKSNIDRSFEDIIKMAYTKYRILYIRPNGMEEEEDIKSLVTEFTNIEDFDIDFKDGKQTSINITYKNKPILRMSFNWKNVFQGIETPCFCIFLAS